MVSCRIVETVDRLPVEGCRLFASWLSEGSGPPVCSRKGTRKKLVRLSCLPARPSKAAHALRMSAGIVRSQRIAHLAVWEKTLRAWRAACACCDRNGGPPASLKVFISLSSRLRRRRLWSRKGMYARTRVYASWRVSERVECSKRRTRSAAT